MQLALLLHTIDQGQDFLKGRYFELPVEATVCGANFGNALPGT